MWTRDSANKLFFIERDDKYSVFEQPQMYLVPATSDEHNAQLDSGRKQQMIDVRYIDVVVNIHNYAGVLLLSQCATTGN